MGTAKRVSGERFKEKTPDMSIPANPAAHLLHAAADLAPAYWTQRNKTARQFHSGTTLLMLYESLLHDACHPVQTDAVGLLSLAAAGQGMEPTLAKAAINGAVVALHSIVSPGTEPNCASESDIAAMRVFISRWESTPGHRSTRTRQALLEAAVIADRRPELDAIQLGHLHTAP